MRLFRKKSKYKVPKSWSDITMLQAINYFDADDKLSSKLSVLLNISNEEAEAMTIDDVTKIQGKLNWLEELPKPSKKRYFNHKGKHYSRKHEQYFTIAELSDLTAVLDKHENAGHKALAVCSHLFMKGFNNKYDNLQVEENTKAFMDLPANIGIGQMLFFSIGIREYLLSSLSRSLKRVSKKMTLKQIQEQEQLQVLMQRLEGVLSYVGNGTN